MKQTPWSLLTPKYAFLLTLFFCSLFTGATTQAQKILQVGAGEYFTSFRADNGRLYSTKWSSQNPFIYDVGIANVTDVDGAQYTNVALTSDGSVYVVGLNAGVNDYATLVPTDNLGNPFKGNTKVYGFYQCYLSW